MQILHTLNMYVDKFCRAIKHYFIVHFKFLSFKTVFQVYIVYLCRTFLFGVIV